MKNFLMLFAVIMIVVGFTTKVEGQTTSGLVSNNSNAQILGAIGLTAVTPLEFGGIVPDATNPGTVIVDYADVRTKSGTLTLVSSKVTPKSGAYNVSGTGLVGYVITIPTADFNITNTTGIVHETMAVSAMTCSKGAGSTFAADGTDAFKVGGTLTVAAAQAPGLYTGTFNVTVAY